MQWATVRSLVGGTRIPHAKGCGRKKVSSLVWGATEKRQSSGEKQGGATAIYMEAGRTTDAHKVKGVDEGIAGGVDSKMRGTDEAAGSLQRP